MKLTILAMLLFTGSVFAQVQTPTVFLNEKIRSAQLAVGQRANLRYDLRSIGGQHLAVKLFHHSQSFNDRSFCLKVSCSSILTKHRIGLC